MKKTILLIQPPVEDFYATDCRTQPLGLCYLSAAIQKRFPEIQVVLYDAVAEGKKRNIPWPREFSYLKKYYGYSDNSPFKLFHQYSRFGKSGEEIREALEKYSPFLVGISSMFTAYYRQSLEMAEICRDIFPEAKIVMGGNHATVAPNSLLGARKNGQCLVDYVIQGEGEAALANLVDRLSGGENIPRGILPGQTPDIHSLPHPDISGLDFQHYRFKGKPMCFLVTSRSCPYRCSFCGIHAVFGGKYRRRKNSDILGEIQQRVAQGIGHIDIEDDHFSASKNETHALLDEIIARNWPITFSAMNGIVYWSLDADLLYKMKKAGFESLNLSLVSTDDKSLGDANRLSRLDEFAKVVWQAFEMGFLITAYFIIGRPGQTVGEMVATLRFLASLPVLIGASPYYLCPGTPDFEKFGSDPALTRASAKYDPLFSARLSAMDTETGEFNRDDVFTIFKMSRVINHMKTGIDRGYAQDHDFFKSAVGALSGGKWFAESKTGAKVELPFSADVARKISGPGLAPNICGYKTKNRLPVDFLPVVNRQ